MAGVAAYVSQNGGGDAHARHHVRVRAFRRQHVAFLDAVKLQSRTQKFHFALTRPARSAVAFKNQLSRGKGVFIHFMAAHENDVGVQFQFFIPAGFRPGLHKPQLPLAVEAEFRVHDNPVISTGNGPHALGDAFRSGNGDGPAIDFIFGNRNFLGAALIVINYLYIFAAHVTDNHGVAVIALKNSILVRGDDTPDHGLAQAVAHVNGDKIVADGAPAAGGRIG